MIWFRVHVRELEGIVPVPF